MKASSVALAFVWAWVIVFSLGHLYMAQASAEPLPPCQFEDGSDINQDGYCLWVDPDTGEGYVNPTYEEVFGEDN